jgi:hypothetical protein
MKNMKNIHLLTVLLAAALFLGCRATPPHDSGSSLPVSHITLTVSCSDAKMGFTGTIVRDGHTKQVSGTGSGTFHVTGYEIVASFKKTCADGRISLEGSEAGVKLGNSTTDQNFGGVRAVFQRTPSVLQSFSTF